MVLSLPLMINTAINIHVQVVFVGIRFHLSLNKTRNGMVSNIMCVFNFTRKCQAILQSGCSIFHSPLQNLSSNWSLSLTTFEIVVSFNLSILMDVWWQFFWIILWVIMSFFSCTYWPYVSYFMKHLPKPFAQILLDHLLSIRLCYLNILNQVISMMYAILNQVCHEILAWEMFSSKEWFAVLYF